jgi:hypothetical protein
MRHEEKYERTADGLTSTNGAWDRTMDREAAVNHGRRPNPFPRPFSFE